MWRASRFVLLGIALCGPPPVQAKTELLKTRLGSVVHWSPPTLAVGLDTAAPSRSLGAGDVSAALAAATEAWNSVRAQQPALRMVTDGRADVTIRFCRRRWQGDTIDLGKSEFTASLHDGTVSGATVEINECDHRFVANAPAGNGYDLQAVLTHELGHVLGLGHSNNPRAIMYPNGGGTTVRTPNIEDQTTLALIYFGRAGIGSAPTESQRSAGPAALAPAQLGGDGRFSLATRAQPSRELPADSISLLSLKTIAGREVMVYTCEPTLLPAIETAALPHDVRRSGDRRRDRRGSHEQPR